MISSRSRLHVFVRTRTRWGEFSVRNRSGMPLGVVAGVNQFRSRGN
jgi:hypothetical protein